MIRHPPLIGIEKETPEVKKTLEYLNSLTGVSIIVRKGARADRESVWDDAIALLP